jgi:hypothetical protein
LDNPEIPGMITRIWGENGWQVKYRVTVKEIGTFNVVLNRNY